MRRLHVLFVFSSLASLAVVYSGALLPMTDLPQHEAQLALWLRHDTGPHAELYELNPLTPYLLFYVLGRALSLLLGVHEAMRALVVVAVIALPCSLLHLLRRAGGDPYWSLLGFPLAFNVSFGMGFLNFMLALPLGLLLIASAYDRDPRSPRRWLLVAGCSLLLFASHALAWLACVVAACAASAGRGGLPTVRMRRALPLLAGLPLALGWFLVTRATSPMASQPTEWNLGPERLGALPRYLLGEDPLAMALSASLLAALALGARRLSPTPSRWAPLAAASALYLLAPWYGMGTYHLYPRFAVLVVLLAALALDPLRPSPRRRLIRGALACAALLSCVALSARVRTFNHATAGFMAVRESVPDGAQVYGLIFDPKVPPLTGDPLLHVPALVAVERDVVVEPSFARSFPTLVRYRPGARPPLDTQDPLRELRTGPYDHVLVRSAEDVDELFPKTFASWREVARSGEWSVWRR